MDHSNLINSLLSQMRPIVADFPLLYDMSYRRPGRTGDEPRVSAPRVDPALPMGDARALRALHVIKDRTVTALVRLAYIAELHGVRPPAMAVGDSQAAIMARLEAVTSILASLDALPALRADKAMTEQLIGRFSAPNVAECIEAMGNALVHALPKPNPGELDYKLCAICHERPTSGNRKRCPRCHSHFSKHGRERPTEKVSEKVDR